MKQHIYKTVEALLPAFAAYFIQQGEYFIKEQGQFNVVLSGGSSPKQVYELLASPNFRDKLAWEKVYFFFGDERYVPADDPNNNALMVENALFRPLTIAADHVFKINTALPPAESAQHYMESITQHFKNRAIHFDLILLGLGDNAHTASLFPFTPVLAENKAAVREVYLEAENTYRITMSAPLINQAKHIAFLVFGQNKAIAVQQVIQGKLDPEAFPAQLIRAEHGELDWFLDREAASLL